MFTIGDFARLGQVSVRMLRHYDAIGLLRPERAESNGYRRYGAHQLARLNRIVALKDLGFSLEQVGSIIDDQLSPDELRGMLRLRRADLQAEVAAANARLAGVEARLRLIESENGMPHQEVQLKHVPPIRVAELTAIADGFDPESIGPVLTPLFPELLRGLAAAGVNPTGPAIAYYETARDSTVLVHAAVPVSDTGDRLRAIDGGPRITDLPAVDVAAIVHNGPMAGVLPTLQVLATWLEAGGYQPAGLHREVYLHYAHGDPDTWATELQAPVRKEER
jgi:DNA-binding transcriptional MerR regulator